VLSPTVTRPSSTIVPLARGQSFATNNSDKLVGAGAVYSVSATASQAPMHQFASLGAGGAPVPGQPNLEDAPDAIAEWEEATNLITVWLGMAIGTFILR
jgi:hypothetical protein